MRSCFKLGGGASSGLALGLFGKPFPLANRGDAGETGDRGKGDLGLGDLGDEDSFRISSRGNALYS